MEAKLHEIIKVAGGSVSTVANNIASDALQKIFSVKEVSSSYEVAENTARTHLNKLVTLKLLLQSKDGRTVMYFVPSDLNQRINQA